MVVVAEKFDCVTILFSDIVTFTNIAAACTPMDVVSMLNELYHRFDTHTNTHDVYKVLFLREKGRQTDRQTDRQAGRQADRQAGRQAGRQTDGKTQTNKKGDRTKEREADRQTNREREREADR